MAASPSLLDFGLSKSRSPQISMSILGVGAGLRESDREPRGLVAMLIAATTDPSWGWVAVAVMAR